MRQLYERGPHCQGLAVDAEGVMLGPDCVLVRRLPGGGYRSAGPDAVALLARTVFDDDVRLRRLPIVLSGIVAALDHGDLVKAQLLGLEIPIDRLDEPRLQRLGRAADLLKDGFDPNELRDEHGQWAREGGAAARVTPPPAPKASLLGRLAPAVLRALRQLAARLAATMALEAVAFLGIIFIPTNRSLISQGTVPDRPDLSFEFDEGAGRLRLYRQDGDSRSLVFEGRPDADGIIRDNDGHAIGRKLDGSVVILDPDTCQARELATTTAAPNSVQMRAKIGVGKRTRRIFSTRCRSPDWRVVWPFACPVAVPIPIVTPMWFLMGVVKATARCSRPRAPAILR